MTPYSNSKAVCVSHLFPPLMSLLTLHLVLQSRRSFSSPINISQSSFTLRFALFTSDRPVRLNSTLSVRIEELNAQISALHVENLRLRASEIALGSQLKKEKEKSQRIITDAESAVSAHFYILASSHCSRKSCSTATWLTCTPLIWLCYQLLCPRYWT